MAESIIRLTKDVAKTGEPTQYLREELAKHLAYIGQIASKVEALERGRSIHK
jgi:hypothetical protein